MLLQQPLVAGKAGVLVKPKSLRIQMSPALHLELEVADGQAQDWCQRSELKTQSILLHLLVLVPLGCSASSLASWMPAPPEGFYSRLELRMAGIANGFWLSWHLHM